MKTALENLFERHYPDGPGALRLFRERLAQAKLDFDVEACIREQKLPRQAGFPLDLPSFIYYYVPGTQFGSGKKLPVHASDPAHAFSSDGIGLNMGCPIRLSRGLEVLFSLKAEYRSELLAQLKARKNHFACVEELLWPTLWKQQTELSRGGELVQRTDGNKRADIDWFFFSAGVPIYIEVKFRPTDWMRTSDGGAKSVNERFFGDIGHKFPAEKSALRRCLAAITGFAEPIAGFVDADSSFFALCERKLLSTPGLNGILYRSLLGCVYVCSLEKEVVGQIAPLIRFPEFGDYPLRYPVVFNRQLRMQRAEREGRRRLREQSPVFFAIVPKNQPTPQFQPQYPYRFRLSRRSKDGEPVFESISPFLNLSTGNEE
jgi:hypothetical protein